jgi:hypothetical protein
LTAHLAGCGKCTIVSEEVDEVGSYLAMVMLPLLLGGVAGGSLLATFGHGSAAYASNLPIPDIPVALDAAIGSGVLAAPIAGGLSMGAATGAGTVVGGFAVVAVILGGVALGVAPSITADADPGTEAPVGIEQSSEQRAESTDSDESDAATDPLATDPLATDLLEGDTAGVVGTLGETVDAVIDTVTNDDGQIVSADISLHLTGTGTPGATVTASAAGNVYATVEVDASGHYVIDIAAFPGGLSSIALVQTIDENYLSGLVLGDNPLAGILGLVDGLVEALLRPLGLSSGAGTLNVVLTNGY